jgi:RNA polymerase sigma-70 factor (ECF subfamily)
MFYQLSAYAQSALNDRSLAEEAVQDTFRMLAPKPTVFCPVPIPRMVAEYSKKCYSNAIRSMAYLSNLVVFSMDFDENMVSGEPDAPYIDILYSDLADNEDYKLLKKIALDKCTMLEAAKELGISVEASKKRVQRAKKKLKKHFEENN